jgi:tripartite-type tricarboxylate transporter receptor subunit TctC
VVGIEIAAKAAADGYTLFYAGSILWLLPLLQDHVPYDTLRDFVPVSLVVDSPNIILVHPSVAAKSVKDLIALAKAKPGALNYGSGGAGSSGHLAAELFKAMAGVEIVRIPFKGTGPALAALISGEIQVLMGSSGGTTPHIKSGRVRALAITSARRSALYPELPTVAESGLPGYEYGQTSGLFAPAKTPAGIVNALSRETAKAINRPDLKEKFSAGGGDVEGSTPREFLDKIKSEITRLGKVIKDSNIRAE